LINPPPASNAANGGNEGHYGWAPTATDPGNLGWNNGTGLYFLKRTGFFAGSFDQNGNMTEAPGLDDWN
jgi:hypothetical protein